MNCTKAKNLNMRLSKCSTHCFRGQNQLGKLKRKTHGLSQSRSNGSERGEARVFVEQFDMTKVDTDVFTGRFLVGASLHGVPGSLPALNNGRNKIMPFDAIRQNGRCCELEVQDASMAFRAGL